MEIVHFLGTILFYVSLAGLLASCAMLFGQQLRRGLKRKRRRSFDDE